MFGAFNNRSMADSNFHAMDTGVEQSNVITSPVHRIISTFQATACNSPRREIDKIVLGQLKRSEHNSSPPLPQ